MIFFYLFEIWAAVAEKCTLFRAKNVVSAIVESIWVRAHGWNEWINNFVYEVLIYRIAKIGENLRIVSANSKELATWINSVVNLIKIQQNSMDFIVLQ